jgi:hypothetical protein
MFFAMKTAGKTAKRAVLIPYLLPLWFHSIYFCYRRQFFMAASLCHSLVQYPFYGHYRPYIYFTQRAQREDTQRRNEKERPQPA